MTRYVKMEDGNSLTISEMLNSIERYNLDHLKEIEDYVEEQARENTYDLEANLAVLKLYQFNPHMMDLEITYLILLKSLTNLPHTDFVLAKCLLLPVQMQDNTIREIIYLADILEQCDFQLFWDRVEMNPSLFSRIVGFYDSIRKFVCHVVGITFQTVEKSLLSKLLGGLDDGTLNQWIKRSGWKVQGHMVFVASQDENIKTKNITEKIEFDTLAGLMASMM
ncbi:unnamed protein product [Hermetia illucens]|uniref:Eukaryotic translation initiation factor 3 subunit K n=1 Tax=Hermetia illucens TaxID=343691 RepID=A0A7R8UFX7_HERIL|nr:eukaryotic translation initiation factor 3 subunit K [Hermetia illucens]CAD7080081.1 unnamed protein product [Hermetia illucens]